MASQRAALCLLAVGDAAPITFDRAQLDAAWREGVLLLLWHRFARHIQPRLVPDDLAELTEDLRLQSVQRILVRHALGQLAQHCHRHQIPILCLKGPALSQRLYQPQERGTGDLDLLIAPEHLPRLTELLAEQGYAPLPHHPLLWRRQEVLLDLHPDPLGAERIRTWHRLTPMSTATLFARAQPSSPHHGGWLELDDGALLAYLVFHAAKHSFDRLIWLIDIARLSTRITAAENWPQTLKTLEDWRLTTPAAWALSYAHTHLRAEIPEPVLAQLQQGLNPWGRHIEARLLRHERIPFLAERLFSRMLPWYWKPLFWWETVFPRAEVRRQIVGDEGGFGDLLRQRWDLVRRAKP